MSRRRSWSGLALLLAVALVPGLVRLETDNSPSVFFVRGSESVEAYRSFTDTFGSDEAVRVVLEGPNLWQPASLHWLADLEEKAGRIPGVLRVNGLYDHHRRFGWPPKDPAAFVERATANPLDRGAGLISADGGMATILVQVEATSPAEGRRLLNRLDALLESPPPGVQVRSMGLPVLNRELDRSAREIGTRYFPLLIFLTLALLFWVVRKTSEIVTILVFVGFCQLMVLGLMGYVGARLNLVLSVLPPLVFVISLATGLHLLLRFRHLPVSGRSTRAAATMTDKGWSVVWTGVTTVVGFASLAASPVAPVRSLGIWAALGLASATVAALVLLPSVLADVGGRRPIRVVGGFEGVVADTAERWAGWAHRHRSVVLASTVVLGALAALGLPRIEVESNALRYLAVDHPLRAGIARLEAEGIGVAAIELTLTLADDAGGAPPPFVSANEVDRLADLGSALEQKDTVFGVINAGVVLREAATYVPSTPMNAHMRQQMVLDGMRQDAQGKDVLDSLLSADRQTARSTLFVATRGAKELAPLRREVESLAQLHFPEAEVQTTGRYPLLLEAQEYLLSTLVLSLALTIVAVGLVLRFLLPSYRLAFLALVPNLWPVLGALGFMGWLGLPLDIATVMMASVVLGLAVDDSIHTLGHFRKWAPVHGNAEAVRRTLRVTGPAYLLTGTILIAGFGVCALSDFAPISRFGGLSALGIGLALVGDVFLLPALLSLVPDEVCERLGAD